MASWYWLVFGVILVSIELLSLTSHAFWLAISAFVTGLATQFFPAFANPLYQIALFSITEIILLLLIRYFFSSPTNKSTTQNNLNARLEQYQGQNFQLIEPLQQGRGAIKAGDTRWPVVGDEELPTDAWITVVGSEGVALKVRALKSPPTLKT